VIGKGVNHVVGTGCKPCVRYGPPPKLACPARFERATYALEAGKIS